MIVPSCFILAGCLPRKHYCYYFKRKGKVLVRARRAVMSIMKCPVLWMNCVKHFVKRLHVKNIKNKKVVLKIQSISASSLQFKAGGKVFC